MIKKARGKEKTSKGAKGTRDAILLAALEEFALHSVDGARTRDIAKKAKVNHASINYHFGSKEEMYARIIEETATYIDTILAEVNKEVADFLETAKKAPQQALKLVKKVLLTQQQFFYEPQFLTFHLLVKREEIFPTNKFDIIFRHMFKPLFQNFSRLIEIASNFKRSKKECAMLSVVLKGLNNSLVNCKRPYLKLISAKEITSQDLALFDRLICESVDKLLK